MTTIIGIVLIVLALISGFVILAATSADASTLLSLVSTMVVVINTIITVRTNSAVGRVEQATNGQQNKLIDAAINSTPPVTRD